MTPTRAGLEFLVNYLGNLPKKSAYYVQWDESNELPTIEVYTHSRKAFNEAVGMLAFPRYTRNEVLPGEVNGIVLNQFDISILSPEASALID